MKRTVSLVSASLLVAWLGVACNSIEVDVDGDGEEENPPATDLGESALSAKGSSYFILTHLDFRRCASPICGGYFVRAVNLRRTLCAGGNRAEECHAFRLDFSSSGLDPQAAESFERELFAQQHGLVRGSLVRRPVTPSGLFEEVLVVTEAWAGQARSKPAGTSYRPSPSGRLCFTTPCDAYHGKKLNVGNIRAFNAVNLATSGAPPDAVEAGLEALAEGQLLAVGAAVPVTRRYQDFRASEFYLRLAGPRRCGSRGLPACGPKEYCDFPEGSQCGAADQGGVCRRRPEICQAIFKPVCGCDGQSYGNACEAAAGGTDVSSEGSCRAPCQRQDAVGVGPCDAILGYAWDGRKCQALSGCSCQGSDCGQLYPSGELCQDAHRSCPVPCASSAECAAGEVCTTEDGVCNPPPGCLPGTVCPAVCYGSCRPRVGVGDICRSPEGEEVASCGAGLKCCYPCGIAGCAWTCAQPCKPGDPACADGCFLFP
jgi:hypothetical protein